MCNRDLLNIFIYFINYFLDTNFNLRLSSLRVFVWKIENYFIEKFSCLLFYAFIISNFLPSNLRNIVAILLLVISIVYVFKEKIKFTTDSDALKLLKSYVYFS